jgi:hypothetical protein
MQLSAQSFGDEENSKISVVFLKFKKTANF